MSDLTACTLIKRFSRASGIESFRLRPAREVLFLAGQYVQVVFDPDNIANPALNKFLSLSAAPGLGFLEVTKKLSASVFSEHLRGLQEGDRLFLRGPFGNCILREGDEKAVFLAGGIGITPVVAMVENALARRPDLPVQVFTSSRREDEFAFTDELETLAIAHPSLWLHFFLTAGTPTNPRIRSGRITKERLQEAILSPGEWVFFVFGPPPMVEAMKTACLEIGVPQTQIRSEGFAGY